MYIYSVIMNDLLYQNTLMSREDKYASFIDFEDRCSSLKHYRCECCHTTRIENKGVPKRGGTCTKCKRLGDVNYYLKSGCLPVWYHNGDTSNKPQFRVPSVLSNLTQAEKMLIQRVSPLVPMHHIKNGTCGTSGHVCAFEQDINEFVQRLPRRREDTTILRVIKTMKSEIGSLSTLKKAFRVRRKAVEDALVWLKKHNPLYGDIVIDMTNLDWFEGRTGLLDNNIIETNEELHTPIDDTVINADRGPAPFQAFATENDQDNIRYYGYMDQGGQSTLSENDDVINTTIQAAVLESPKKDTVTIDYPTVSAQPVDEYSDKKIFALAFPWLFPGGFGDVIDFKGDLGTWGHNLIYYEDARFATDKLFSFFALNYITRHRNSAKSNWFISDFYGKCPDSLEELHERIKAGDTSFVNYINYYNDKVRGSSPYWRSRRQEVYSWINHHIEEGHGAPTYFITLSCAEYFWPDVLRLIQERMIMAGIKEKDAKAKCNPESKQFVQIIHDYSIVIQEYFQEKTKIWLETVGKKVFGIKYYWLRYEFAPGRGQIHAHLLAIPEEQYIFKHCYEQSRNDEEMKAKLLSDWAEKKFGLTASVDSGFDNIEITRQNCPSTIRFKDVCSLSLEEQRNDSQRLMKSVQYHTCSAFCLRDDKNTKG